MSAFNAIVPMLCVTLAALAVMGAEAVRAKGENLPIGGLGIGGLVGAAAATVMLWDRNAASFGVIVADNFGLFVTLVLLAVGVLTIMFSSPVIGRDGLPKGDYYALVLFSIAGMIMMATANDLLVVFIALEILSIAVYVLTGIRRDDPRATEAAFKYFLLGAFSSAFFLYGIAFTYGVSGSTRLDRVGAYLAAQALSDNPLILVGLGLLLVGFAFKISAVPFHMWTPDAYQGAPSPITGFMAASTKLAAFAALLRLLDVSLFQLRADWRPLVIAIAVATMLLGSLFAVVQEDGDFHEGEMFMATGSIAQVAKLSTTGGLVAAEWAGCLVNRGG